MDHHFWEAVCTIIFLGLAYRPAKKIIFSKLDEYRKNIADQIQEAEALKNEAEKTLSKYKRLHQEFVKKSELVAKTSKENIEKIADESSRKLKETIDAQKKLHKERLYLYELETLNTIRKNAVSRAFVIAKLYLQQNHHQVSAESFKKLLTSSKFSKKISH